MTNMAGKRILMALTRFDIGGAETHVLELSLELKRMGYYVVVVSNGGVYEQNLKEAGIHHYKIPMHSKTPVNIAKSLRALNKVIKDEKIEIVHAHGRIPAFLCGILNKFVKFTFVTTAHWVFDTSHGLKYVSNWGEKVMAVSEDIKAYLMENYHTNPADIYVTINGIDTNKFCREADVSSVISEFSLSPDSKKIVYISRMDKDRAQLAFELVEIAPEIVKEFPDIEIVIVGGGNVFLELQKKTEEYDWENKAGLTTPEQKNFQLKLLELLSTWTPDSTLAPKEAFLFAKTGFDKQCQLRTDTIKKASSALENAFTFMEEAFGEGQEMVVFITELTMDPDASRFITENGCERYFKYNKTLLVGSRRATILKELEHDRIYSNAMEYEF